MPTFLSGRYLMGDATMVFRFCLASLPLVTHETFDYFTALICRSLIFIGAGEGNRSLH